MTWHAQNLYQEEIGIDSRLSATENGSFVTALANLLIKFGVTNHTPITLSHELLSKGITRLEWSTVTEYDKTLIVDQIGDYNTWPSTNNSIVKFRTVGPDGKPMDHYCLVADPIANTIIDSVDGELKNPGVYGQPVAWASYIRVAEEQPKTEVEEVEVAEEQPKKKRRFFGGAPKAEKVERVERSEDDPIQYESIGRPRTMHFIKAGGAKKWSFGNLKQIEDLRGSGYYAEGVNIDIVGIAHVTVGDQKLAYYMDEASFGDWVDTGKVRFTTGYNWGDLMEGVAVKPKPAPVAERRLAENADPDIALAVTPGTYADITPGIPSKSYKNTYKEFESGPRRYVAERNVDVQEHDGARPSKPLSFGQEVNISGTFQKDDILYCRPAGAAQSNLWYGIPMADLTPWSEVYNTDVSLADRAKMKGGRLTLQEQGVVALSRAVGLGTQLKGLINKKYKVKE